MKPQTPKLSRSGDRAGYRWGVAAAGILSTLLAALPLRAAVLSGWTFDPGTRQLTLTLPDSVTPEYFLLAEPARIVLDLPNTAVGDIDTERRYSGAIRSIRVSQYDPDTARIVVEFAPNTVLDPRHAELSSTDLDQGTRWVLRPLVASPGSPSTATSPSTASASATAALPDLPDAAAAGAAEAAQPTPPASAEDGIRTDASALSGSPSDTSSSPDRLPVDLLGSSSSSATVSVPPLAERDAESSAPQVSVPPLDTVPESAASPPPAQEIAQGAPPPDASTASSAASPASPDVVVSEGATSGEATEEPAELASDEASPPPILESPPASPSEEPAETASAATGSPPVEPATTPASAATPPPAAAETASPEAIAAPPFLSEPAPEPTTGRPSIPPPPPVFQGDGTIPFGTPLPDQAKASDAATAPETTTDLPVGTRLRLRYPGPAPLVLEQPDPWYEVLVLAEPVRHPRTEQVIFPTGTEVLGRFEGVDDSGQRFVTQAIVQAGDRQPLLAESDWLVGQPRDGADNLLVNSGIGAAAVTVLSGFSGIGLLGGAALGAATTYAGTPQVVVIEPGQIIEAEVVSEILPFSQNGNE